MIDLGALWNALVDGAPWAGLVALMGVMWRSRVPMRKLKVEADASLRTDLLRQLAEQERQHKEELAEVYRRLTRYEDKLEAQRATYEARLEFERVSHAGEMASFRHKAANLEQSLNMLLALVESNPEKAGEAAKKVREMREKQESQESAEKTAISAAKITAAAPNSSC